MAISEHFSCYSDIARHLSTEVVAVESSPTPYLKHFLEQGRATHVVSLLERTHHQHVYGANNKEVHKSQTRSNQWLENIPESSTEAICSHLDQAPLMHTRRDS